MPFIHFLAQRVSYTPIWQVCAAVGAIIAAAVIFKFLSRR